MASVTQAISPAVAAALVKRGLESLERRWVLDPEDLTAELEQPSTG
jgi:hypothetical protein